MALNFTDIVDPADMRVRNLTREADLIAEALNGCWVLAEGFGKELERDLLAKREVVGPINLAHSAPAQQGNYTVAAGEQGTGKKTALR